MTTYKFNWINNFQVKSSKHASNNMGHNLSRKLAVAKRIFLPDLNMSKNSEKIHAYRGWKYSGTVKISAHSELQNRNEKSNHAQICAGIKSLDANSNFFKPKWVKLGTLLKIPEKKTKN